MVNRHGGNPELPDLGKRGPSPSRNQRQARCQAFLRGDPAAQRHWQSPYRACPELHTAGCPGPLAPHARLRHPVTAWHRPCRNRYPDGGGAETRKKSKHTRQEMGRPAFVEEIWRWKQDSGDSITQQLRWLGASCDWSQERFTLDEGMSRAVNTAFARMFQDGLICRQFRLNREITCLTARREDAKFLEKAPPAIVETTRDKLKDTLQRKLVGQRKDGSFCAIQYKCYDPSHKVSRNDIIGFMVESAKSPSSAALWSPPAHRINNLEPIRARWKMPPPDWPKICFTLSNGTEIRIPRIRNP